MPVVEANGTETYYEDYGDGHPIVVLHGANVDHQVWAEQLQPLTGDYRVIPYDLRGHGKTGGSDLNRYTIDTYVDDLAAFIDALDLNRPTILGHSWGGMIGYAFANAHPEKLSSLVSLNARTPESFSTGERAFMAVQTNILLRLVEYEPVLNAGTWAMEKLFGDDSTPDTDTLEAIRDNHECDMPEVETEERAKIGGALREYTASSWSWDLSGVPTLMLYGENEPFIEPHAEFLGERFTDCQNVEIPDASHNSQLDNPEFIRAQVREFLEDLADEQAQVAAE